MRRSYCLLLPLFFFTGCSRGNDEPAAATPLEISEAKPADAGPDPTVEAAQVERDFAIQLARLASAAEQHERRGYFDQAVASRREMLALIEQRYGPGAWQTRSARVAEGHAARLQKLNVAQKAVYLASVKEEESARDHWKSGARPAALTELTHARTSAQQLWGPTDYMVGNLFDLEADWRQSAGEGAKAEALARQALSIREQVFTRDHPDSIGSISRLGLILQVEKKPAEAEPLLLEALERSRALWGETHAEYARHLNNLGMLDYDRAKLPQAIETLTQALAVRQQSLPAGDPLIAHSLFNLGSAFYAAKNYAAASPRLQQAHEIFLSSVGESHSMTRLTRANLAMSLMAEKKYAEAETVFRQDFEIAQRTFGDRSALAAECLLRLGILYGNQGRYAEAEPLVSHAAATERSVLGAEHPSTKKAEQVASLVRSKLASSPRAKKNGAIQTSGQTVVGGVPQPAAIPPGPVLVSPPAAIDGIR